MTLSTLIPYGRLRFSVLSYFYIQECHTLGRMAWVVHVLPLMRGDPGHYFYIEDSDAWGIFFETLIITSFVVSLRGH